MMATSRTLTVICRLCNRVSELQSLAELARWALCQQRCPTCGMSGTIKVVGKTKGAALRESFSSAQRKFGHNDSRHYDHIGWPYRIDMCNAEGPLTWNSRYAGRPSDANLASYAALLIESIVTPGGCNEDLGLKAIPSKMTIVRRSDDNVVATWRAPALRNLWGDYVDRIRKSARESAYEAFLLENDKGELDRSIAPF